MLSFRQIVLIVLVAACLASVVWVLPTVDRSREVYRGLTFVSDISPPEIVLLTHLLGGFKSLLVDVVWIRAVKLQQA